MEPSQISLNKVTLNVSSPKDGGVSLNKGEMVKGTVQEVRPDGLVMIVIKGKLVEAVAEVAVKPGQDLYLLVDDFRNGKTYLKLVSPEMMGKIENANIKANLLQMGITVKEETILLASKLLQHNLPVTPDSLNELARVVKLIGGSNPRNLEIATFALARGIVNREALTALASFLSPETNKAQLITVLNRWLSILTTKLSSALESSLSSVKGESATPIASIAQETATATPVKGEVASQASNVAQGTNTASPAREGNTGIYQPILPDSEAEVPSQNASRAASSETPRLMLENLLKLVSASAGTAEPDGNTALKIGEFDRSRVLSGEIPVAQTDNDSGLTQDNLTVRVVNLLQTLVDIMELDPASSPDKIAEKIQNSTQSEKEIIKALLLLEDLGADKRIGEKIPSLKDLPLRLENLEKEISGQRLFNLSSRTSGENISSYYFSFPVKMDNDYSLCQLRINKDTRKNLKDLDSLNFVVSLNTSKLGIVVFHVNWHRQGNIKLQGVVESQATCNYINKNMGELVAKLQGLGFKVSNLGVKVSVSPAEINCAKPGFEDVTQKIRPLGIDVTV